MAGVPLKKPATYSDLEALPDNLVGEIIDGDLFASPRPAIRHANASTNLAGLLGPPYRFGRGGPGGWVLLYEPELHLGSNILVPDLAGWRRERMPEVPDAAAISLSPDWVCEVLSPSTERIDRVRKQRAYGREQVEYVWHLNPIAQTLEVFHLEIGRWVQIAVYEGEEKVHAEPFAEIELDLALLWAR